MRRTAYLFLGIAALATGSPALAQQTSAQEDDLQQEENADEKKKPIIVYGRSLKDTEDALAACLARGCPPDEDINATLGHAENLFLEGDYKEARSTILKSIDRNGKFSKDYPVDVSDLYRSNAKVAEHLGEGKSYQLSVLEMRESLEDGLEKDDTRILLADLEVGDSRAKLGYPDEAYDIYERVEKKALASGRPGLASMARIRTIVLKSQYAVATKDKFRIREAREELDDFINNPIAGAEDFVMVGEILRARLDRQLGVATSTEDLIESYAKLGETDRPVLLFSEPIEFDNRSSGRSEGGGNTLNQIAVDNFDDKWADLGFWVNAKGRVSEIEVLRSSGDLKWLKYVKRSLESRIYTPLKTSKEDPEPGFYMIERYSFTARWGDRTGTRIRQRQPEPRIERLDLTPAAPKPASETENREDS